MRILVLTHGFNSLTQRLFMELQRLNHQISIEFDINDAITEQAVAMFKPDLILAPFLKRSIPESIWRNHRCIIVHPGVKGDRGPSSLDWAIMRGEAYWGVTCIDAVAEMDAGDIWATVVFPMRSASKSSVYRNEVTEAAVTAVKLTLARLSSGDYQPEPLCYDDPEVKGQWNGLVTQGQRRLNWQVDTSAVILTKIRAADSQPGVKETIAGREYYLYNATLDTGAAVDLKRQMHAKPGSIIAMRDRAICFATLDAAVWVTHLRLASPIDGEFAFKLPATYLLGTELLQGVDGQRVVSLPLEPEEVPAGNTWQEIRYREEGQVGYLHFDFYNGAMDNEQCSRLQQAVAKAKAKPINVLVLMGGRDYWSNGIHLNQIEAAQSPAEESLRNINAINDLCLEVINTPNQLTLVAMQGSAGAGGVFMALSADTVCARSSVILNPHYKSMGNLYGSEYWTYLLPKRVGIALAETLMHNCLPISAIEAATLGLIDECIAAECDDFVLQVESKAQALSKSAELTQMLSQKNLERAQDERTKPLAQYRAEELERMKLNFFGFDSSYHVARYHFVEKLPRARTPAYLAKHRCLRGKAV